MWYWYVIGALVLIDVILLLVGNMMAGMIIDPKKNKRSLEMTAEIEEENWPGIMEWYSNSLTTEYTLKSEYGYDIRAYYLENEKKTNNFLVIAHGHTYTHHGSLKYAKMMMRKGFNVVLYDQRYHGNSGGKFTSLGYYEKDDLYMVITDTYERYGKDIFLGTYGESMGSATVVMESGMDDRIDFVMSDCGFADFEELNKEMLRDRFHLPVFPFLTYAKIMFRIRAGFSLSKIKPIEALKNTKVPVFFATGYADDYIPYHHTEDMYNAYTGEKMLFLAGNEAYHAGALHKDPINYEAKVDEFLEKYVYPRWNK